MSQYERLAAKRYRQYKRQEQKQSTKKAVMEFLMRLLELVGKMLSRRRTVERIVVE